MREILKMSDNKKYLSDLKQELTQYKNKLVTAEGSFKGKANKEGDKIVKSLQDILKEAGQSYQKLEAASAEEWEPLKKIASKSFEDLKTTFEDLMDTTTGQVKEYANQIEEYSEEAYESGIEYIKSNPFKSILLAGGLGFIVGRILK
jgi:ElaB/YqjD/DUF883 family membrane-anchored ribosome-binding protein